MKTNFLKKSLILSLCTSFLILGSCEREEESINTETAEYTSIVTPVELTKDQITALENNNIHVEGTTVDEFKGTLAGFQVEGLLVDDTFVRYEQLSQWVNDLSSNTRLSIRDSRINLPASGIRNIRVGIINSGFQSLNTAQRNAAINAMQRYNALGIRIRYNWVLRTGQQLMQDNTINMVIFNDTNGNFVTADGRAQFPSNGNPGFLVGLSNGSRNFDQNDLAVLVQHEIGHTIGLAHSDYTTRRSCGQNVNDQQGQNLDVIPGTDATGNVINSIMRACGFFAFNNFQAEDRNSIRRAYGWGTQPF